VDKDSFNALKNPRSEFLYKNIITMPQELVSQHKVTITANSYHCAPSTTTSVNLSSIDSLPSSISNTSSKGMYFVTSSRCTSIHSTLIHYISHSLTGTLSYRSIKVHYLQYDDRIWNPCTFVLTSHPVWPYSLLHRDHCSNNSKTHHIGIRFHCHSIGSDF
jgi:hypothetical protein